jgi:Ca2+-binding RTX toxin-like protein
MTSIRQITVFAALAASVAAAALSVSAPDALAASCAGRTATEVGTKGPDRIRTGPGDDVIVARGGNDDIRTGAGDDSVCAGFGRDTVRGGSGADALRGGSNGDRLHGGAGEDSLFGGILDDRLFGDAGADLLLGGHGVDRILGGPGDDWLRGGTNDDELDGGSQGTDGDTASFSTAMPPLTGDGCAGAAGADGVVVDLTARSASGEGCDRVGGVENVMGSAFSDSISGVPGSVNGGGGADVCPGAGPRVSCGDAAGPVEATYLEAWRPGPSSRLDPGLVVLRGSGADSVSIGEAAPGAIEAPASITYVVAWGGGGNDRISVGPGVPHDATSELDGGPGDDQLIGGPRDDVLFTHAGADTLAAGAGDDALLALGAAVTGEGDALLAGPGDDQLVSNFACGGHRFDGGGGIDVAGFARSEARHRIAARLGGSARVRDARDCAATALRGSEILEGTSGPDVLHGDGRSNPFIWGRQGADRLYGHGGRDRLEGGAGNDTLAGGPGSDSYCGGSGRNSYARDRADRAGVC